MALGVEIDKNGISLKSFREVRDALSLKMRGIFGNDLDLSPSSPDGQLLDLFCYAYNDVAEALLEAYSSLDLNSAEGSFLDNLGALMGVDRNGRDDDTYREILLTQTRHGFATYDNMLAYLRNYLPNVNIIVNDEPTTDENGIEGHAFGVYVPYTAEEVSDDAVGRLIWTCKPAGIKSVGTTSVEITDIAGLKHAVAFSRVSNTDPYYMRVTITEYDEEVLPVNYEELIANAIAQWALNEYTPGKDLIPKRAIQAIYTIDGIDDVVVEVSTDNKNWITSRISIAPDKIVRLPLENISVIKKV